MALKGYLYRKFKEEIFGGENKVFGKKPKPSPQTQEATVIKTIIGQPPMQIQPLQSQVTQQPQQPAKNQTPFVVMEKTVGQRYKSVATPSGQVISTNELEYFETTNSLFQLTLDDIIDVVASCKSTNVGTKFRSLLEGV